MNMNNKINKEKIENLNEMIAKQLGLTYSETNEMMNIFFEKKDLKKMYIEFEKEQLKESIALRKKTGNYKKLSLEETYYFMLKENIKQLSDKNCEMVVKQIYKYSIGIGTDYISKEEAFNEYRKRAEFYLMKLGLIEVPDNMKGK